MGSPLIARSLKGSGRREARVGFPPVANRVHNRVPQTPRGPLLGNEPQKGNFKHLGRPVSSTREAEMLIVLFCPLPIPCARLVLSSAMQ